MIDNNDPMTWSLVAWLKNSPFFKVLVTAEPFLGIRFLFLNLQYSSGAT